jgi:hypothetical protein
LSAVLPSHEFGMPVRVGAIKSTHAHAARIARDCREIDRYELYTGWRHTPDQALRYGLEHSSHVWTGVANLQPFCMVGVVPKNVLCGSGTIWLIATDEILEHQLAFLRRCRPILRRMQAVYSSLENCVAGENVTAIAWLKWLGFTIGEGRPTGPDRAIFHHFEWRRDDV